MFVLHSTPAIVVTLQVESNVSTWNIVLTENHGQWKRY